MWNDLIPIAGMATGLMTMGIITWGLAKVFRGPVGQALGRRIVGHADPLEDEVLELRDVVAGLADELRETQERLDFTERMLAAGPDRTSEFLSDTGSATPGGV